MKTTVKIACLLLAVFMFAPASVSAGTARFTDVPVNAWYYDNVKYVRENGIMKGTSATKFSPDGTLTRGMCVTILHRMAGEPAPEKMSKFSDVPADEYYAGATAWAEERGVVKGKTATSFDPDGAITRAEFATMLFRYAEAVNKFFPEIKTDAPADSGAIPSYAADAVNSMYRAGIVNGRENGAFDPDSPITRAETAAMTERFILNAKYKNVGKGEAPDGGDGVLDIAFFGSSFVWVPKIPGHFEAIAKGKHAVDVNNYAVNGYMLENHLKKWIPLMEKPYYKKKMKKMDVIVLEEALTNLPAVRDLEPLMDLFGRDKYYYSIVECALQKAEDGAGIGAYGQKTFYGYGYGLLSDYTRLTGYTNETLFEMKKEYYWDHGIHFVLTDIMNFDPSLGITYEEMHIENDFHPNKIMGYCEALALYCTMFDEPAAEQNNGMLKDYDVPGDTPEEKAAYMTKLKKLVQEMIDIQK
ncbi:MAG: S-layer homology domain-containing protein [Clostridia bacterium]|nr:S-layer homology domain-containing protein [Clostridia bacterium]